MAAKTPAPDRIAQIFDGSTVLVTGGTGFIGKVIIEKILRLTNVKTVYVLIRVKREKPVSERCKEIIKNPLFNLLRETNPKVLDKCKPICGDVAAPDLGISESDRKRLAEEVDFIYHSAATTRFDDTMKYAVIMNTRGTKLVLDLGQECKHLKCFIHISTAYAFPHEEVLYEKIYAPPANPHDVLSGINWIKEDTMAKFNKDLLGDCPNTYTFTKALAEALAVERMDKMPIIIVRPSVVIPILSEPLPGWCNNLQGPMGLFVGAGKGIIRSMYLNSDSYADFLPADMVVNGVMASTWDFVTTKQRRVFNLCSGKFYKLSWNEIIEIGKEVVSTRMPFNGIVWYPGGSTKKSKLYHNICFYLFQIVPAIFIDALLIVLGYKPVLYGIQRRIQKGGEMFEYYTWKAWHFDNGVMLALRDRLNPRERALYKMDGEDVDIPDYFTQAIHTVRVHILKETDDMLPAARRNMTIMWFLDILVKGLLVFGLFYYLYKIFAPIFA